MIAVHLKCYIRIFLEQLIFLSFVTGVDVEDNLLARHFLAKIHRHNIQVGIVKHGNPNGIASGDDVDRICLYAISDQRKV